MAAATQRGELVALVDTFDRLDVASMDAAGADLGRVLWIRGRRRPARVGDRSRAQSAQSRAAGGGFGLVAIDLADVPGAIAAPHPFTTWLRVQRAVEGRDTACVLVAPEPIARSAGGLTLTLTGRTSWTGSSARPRVAGAELKMRVVSPRRRVDGEVALRRRRTRGRGSLDRLRIHVRRSVRARAATRAAGRRGARVLAAHRRVRPARDHARLSGLARLFGDARDHCRRAAATPPPIAPAGARGHRRLAHRRGACSCGHQRRHHRRRARRRRAVSRPAPPRTPSART
jgi:hypothetical protein